jgi:polysaccharide export outer membrane protein
MPGRRSGRVAWAALFSAAILLSACSGPGDDLQPLENPSQPSAYRLGSGDVVQMRVFGQEELSGPFRINNSGTISVPLLGEIEASGVTTAQLEDRVEGILADGLLLDPSVSIEVTEFRPFYILGEVTDPGQYAYVPDMTVLTAVAIAGGFTFRARTNEMSITRTTDGETIEGRAGRGTIVQPGDVIFVFERIF